MRQRSFKRWICSVVTVALTCSMAAPVLADGESTARSILLPGSGQAQDGHYGKAAIFAGAAIVTGVGWLLSQIHYNQAVTRYNDLRDLYLAYPGDLRSGTVVPGSVIEQTYSDMQEAWDTSDDRQVWRNVFMVSFLAVYAVNIVDILMSEPDTGERVPEESTGALGFELRGDDIRVYKSINF
jgi:hypothetical protein